MAERLQELAEEYEAKASRAADEPAGGRASDEAGEKISREATGRTHKTSALRISGES
jgi:hypothetical protein